MSLEEQKPKQEPLDKKGRVTKRIDLTNEKTMLPRDMISIISKEEKGIDEYFKTKREKIAEHKSMLDDFQL